MLPVCVSAQSFRQVPGKLTSISVGGTSTGAEAVWGINAAQNIFEFDGLQFDDTSGLLTQIAVDGTAVWGDQRKFLAFDANCRCPPQQAFNEAVSSGKPKERGEHQ